MKKIFIAFIALVSLSACTQQKIGYVDSTELMQDYKAVKDLEKEIEEKQNTLQASYQQVALSFEKEVQDFQENSGKMSRKKGEERYQELMMKQQQIQQIQQSESQKLQKESQDKMDVIIDDVKEFVKNYAEKNGFTFILGSNEGGNVLYGDEKLDLTDVLLVAINKEYKNKSGDEEITEEKATENEATTETPKEETKE
jgi:outer membrane protein